VMVMSARQIGKNSPCESDRGRRASRRNRQLRRRRCPRGRAGGLRRLSRGLGAAPVPRRDAASARDCSSPGLPSMSVWYAKGEVERGALLGREPGPKRRLAGDTIAGRRRSSAGQSAALVKQRSRVRLPASALDLCRCGSRFLCRCGTRWAVYCLSSVVLVFPPIEGATYRVSKPKMALTRRFLAPSADPLRVKCSTS
jgi:hypothetical protein